VTKLLIFLAATIGGAIGWWLGAFIGFMTAFFMSVVGTAAGVYVARRWAAEYIE
jgi:cadmium resistance protein CadD (predicted permease)